MSFLGSANRIEADKGAQASKQMKKKTQPPTPPPNKDPHTRSFPLVSCSTGAGGKGVEKGTPRPFQNPIRRRTKRELQGVAPKGTEERGRGLGWAPPPPQCTRHLPVIVLVPSSAVFGALLWWEERSREARKNKRWVAQSSLSTPATRSARERETTYLCPNPGYVSDTLGLVFCPFRAHQWHERATKEGTACPDP